MARSLRIALLTDDDKQAQALETLLQERAVLMRAGSVREFREDLKASELDAVFCGEFLRDGTWENVLEALREDCSGLPVIVLSRCGGEREWIKVLEAGAFDLLVPPYVLEPVLALIEHAAATQQARQWQAPGV